MTDDQTQDQPGDHAGHVHALAATHAATPPRADGANDSGERRLSQLADFEVESGYPDIRGWPVRGSNGRELGVVGDLLVDTELLEVAAVDVHLGVGAAGVRGNIVGSARVPIESVRIQPDQYVIVDVEVIPCEDVLEPSLDASGAVRRVPCGQIGIRRRDEEGRPAPGARDVEVPRAAQPADRTASAPAEPSDRGTSPRAGEGDARDR